MFSDSTVDLIGRQHVFECFKFHMHPLLKLKFPQSPHSDYVTRCYLNLCLQQGSRDDRVSRDVFSFLYA